MNVKFFALLGAKSLIVANFAKQGSKKFECQIRRTSLFCRKQKEMDAISTFAPANAGIKEGSAIYDVS